MTKVYSLKEIAALYGRPYSTTRNHIIKLKKQRVFVKESLGVFYTEAEYRQILKAFGIVIETPAGPIGKTTFVAMPWAKRPNKKKMK